MLFPVLINNKAVFLFVQDLNVNTNSYALTDLIPGSNFAVSVRAVNSDWFSVYSQQIEERTQGNK